MDRLEAMRAFVRLVECGSFTRASRDLGVSQSTVSKWIAALEDELSTTLCERTTRTRTITDAGRLLYPQAKALVEQYDGVREAFDTPAAQVSGRLCVSAPVVFGTRFLTPLLPEFAKRYPNIDLQVIFDDRYIDLVAEGVHVAVRVGAPKDSSFKATTIATSARRLVASPAYLSARGRPRTPKDLGDHDCLRHSLVDTRTTWTFARDGKSHRARVTGGFASNHSGTLLQMALAGGGIALLADWLVRDAVKGGALKLLLTRYTTPTAPLRLVFPPTGQTLAATRAFTAFVRAELPPHLGARA